MATVVLQTVGAAIGGAIGGPVGAIVGRAAGALAGNAIDQQLFSKDRVVEGPRLDTSRLLSSTEGTPIPKVYGRQRMSGQIIWATRFDEVVLEDEVSSKGGGGSGTTTRSFSYFANFAVAICEGEISGIRRIWADGQELDQTKFELRTYTGNLDQKPDPLIEAKQGSGNTPAYRGTAYVVFDSFPLEKYGNRIPQLAFEIVRGIGQLERDIGSMTVIPGATEYGYDTELIASGGTDETYNAQNRHTSLAETDWEASIDELQMVCPNLKSVSLVVTWYGTDLRAGTCEIQPGVTHQFNAGWSVASYQRHLAHLVSQIYGTSAFGGTPSDASVLNAIEDLKARGLQVVLYPFLMMDIPPDNTLSWIGGASAQPAYPWRGEISCFPPPGTVGSSDQSASARNQLQAFSQKYRLMIEHYAALCATAGGVNGFLIGSEFRGLTKVRDETGAFPFVEFLKSLSSDVRPVLGLGCQISYGADWSEYFGYQPDDGSGDVLFNLDPLWASADIDAVGIDNYMPLSDWQNGKDPTDLTVKSIYDSSYLGENISAQEGFDWYYQTVEDRRDQLRTPITDGEGEPWVFRYKDIVSWWSNPHHERLLGIRQSNATEWVPLSKPIWLTEIGCPAVSHGSNQPNVFVDPKSAQSALPYHSNGSRDDLIQRRFLEAHYAHWEKAENNPVSQVYQAQMLECNAIAPWAWDARPFPWFPLDVESWSDGENWHQGHWLNGRLGGCAVSDLVQAILADFGINNVIVELDGILDGYAVPGAVSAREALEPLLGLFDIVVIEEEGILIFRNLAFSQRISLRPEDIIQEDDQTAITRRRDPELELPGEAVVHHGSVFSEYENLGTKSRRLEGNSRRQISLQSSAVMPEASAAKLAESQLRKSWTGREEMALSLGTASLAICAGDIVQFPPESDKEWLIVNVDKGVKQELNMRSFTQFEGSATGTILEQGRVSNPKILGAPEVLIMDLPLLRSANSQRTVSHLAISADPWGQDYGIFTSPDTSGFVRKASHSFQAIMGRLLSSPGGGVTVRWDYSKNIHLSLNHGTLQSREAQLVLNGANTLAVEISPGEFEILQFQTAALQGDGSWMLGGLLRGQLGTDTQLQSDVQTGARAVLLDDRVLQVELDASERGIELNWRIGPAGFPVSASNFNQVTHTNNGRSKTMLSPVHLQSSFAATGDLHTHWVRRGRIDADSWEDADIQLDAQQEQYRVRVLDGSEIIQRETIVTQSEFHYSLHDRVADMGSAAAPVEIRVAQIGDTGLAGAEAVLANISN